MSNKRRGQSKTTLYRGEPAFSNRSNEFRAATIIRVQEGVKQIQFCLMCEYDSDNKPVNNQQGVQVETLQLATTVHGVQWRAFYGCRKLARLVLPKNDDNEPSQLRQIRDEAFAFCALEELTCLENSQLEMIGNSAFRYCKALRNIRFPPSIREIKSRAFEECTLLEEIDLSLLSKHDNVIIGSRAFFKCKSLHTIRLPGSLSRIGGHVFYQCSSLKSIDLSALVHLAVIPTWTFRNCKRLQSVWLPPLLKTIGDEAFENCKSLVQIKLPEAVSELGDGVFSRCRSLTVVEFGSTKTLGELALKEMGHRFFEGCTNLRSLILPKPSRANMRGGRHRRRTTRGSRNILVCFVALYPRLLFHLASSSGVVARSQMRVHSATHEGELQKQRTTILFNLLRGQLISGIVGSRPVPITQR